MVNSAFFYSTNYTLEDWGYICYKNHSKKKADYVPLQQMQRLQPLQRTGSVFSKTKKVNRKKGRKKKSKEVTQATEASDPDSDQTLQFDCY
uniref:Uncharacterized protein n=1 Tax=Magallana gigas TaxID=29159 RepID=A0A8W8IF06_MAGGI